MREYNEKNVAGRLDVGCIRKVAGGVYKFQLVRILVFDTNWRNAKTNRITIKFNGAHPGNRTLVSTVGGYYDTTTPDALDGKTAIRILQL